MREHPERALSNHESSFSIRHTRNANSAVQTAREALGLTFTYVDAFQVEAERLIQQTMTDAAFDALIDATFGKTQAEATKRVRESERRRRSRLHWLFADADTQASIRDRRVHDCRALINFRSGHRRLLALRGGSAPLMSLT